MSCDLSELDREVEAARIVGDIRRETALRIAAWAGRRRRAARGPLHTLALLAVAALTAALTWLARRGR
jgi:hypothetical protein